MSNTNTSVELPPKILQEWYRYRFSKPVDDDALPVYGRATTSFAQFLLNHAGKLGNQALDLACGDGRYACELARTGFQVTAVDVLPEALERASKLSRAHHLEENIKLVLGQVPAVLSSLGEFDLVVCGSCFLHLLGRKTTKETLNEMCSATAPGGVNFVSLSTEVLRRLSNGTMFGYEGEAYFQVAEVRDLIKQVYPDWEVLQFNVNQFKERWDIPPAAKGFLTGEDYERSEKEVIFAVRKPKAVATEKP